MFYDLSVSMGIPGQVLHQDIENAVQKILKACEKNAIIPGILAGKAHLKKYRDMGFKLLLGGLDGHMLYEAALEYKRTFEGDYIKRKTLSCYDKFGTKI